MILYEEKPKKKKKNKVSPYADITQNIPVASFLYNTNVLTGVDPAGTFSITAGLPYTGIGTSLTTPLLLPPPSTLSNITITLPPAVLNTATSGSTSTINTGSNSTTTGTINNTTALPLLTSAGNGQTPII